MKHLKFMLTILMMLVVVILVIQNSEAMSTKMVFKINLFSIHLQSSEISLYYIFPIVFLFGVLIMGLYGIVERFRLKKQIRVLVSSSREKDKELNSLRNLPITSDDVSSGLSNDIVKEAEEGGI